ncbi:MOSC domain-containing protein [Pseudoduganella armeniaca]|uniref:MOSC domain-containing protein n=1 Tax=Pseudoduganella armeniaca TaxID=2072590 RepID=A0A2R4CCL4_9BURK|nr:MOSC domain-containing protein [Pseudoduganella armeniaca]AVR97374.1 hypothetical protein C9I28_18300 [Pseudoduganella armeniaca]
MAWHDAGAGAPYRGLQDTPAGTAIGSVLGLALRADGSSAAGQLLTVPLAQALAGRGLAGDRHAEPDSPRQVLLAGTAAYRQHGLAPQTLRENVLLDVATATLPSGTLLRLGDTAVVGLTFQCEACRYLDARHPGIAGAIGKGRGVLARVLHGGPVRVSDPIVQLPGSAWTWSDDWRERVAQILAQVPDGMVVDYRHLARLAGVQAVYCRALPGLARRLGMAERAAAHYARPELSRWTGDMVFATPAVSQTLPA